MAAKGKKKLGGDERDELRETVRRPPLLASILRDLQSGGIRKQEAKEKLARLCDDVAASQAMRPVTSPPPLVSHTPTIRLPSVQPSIRSQALRTTRATTTQPRHHTQIRIPSHHQGSQFGLAHDPGESSGATARPGNMFAQSTAPARQSSRTSRTASGATSRTPSRVGNSTSRNPTHSHSSRTSHTARTGAHRDHDLSSIPESSQIGRTVVQAAHSTLRAAPPTVVSPHHPSKTHSGPVPSRPPSTYVTRAPGGPTRRPAQNNAYAARSRRPGAPALPSAQTMAYMQGGGTKPPTYIPSPQFFEEHGAEHGMCCCFPCFPPPLSPTPTQSPKTQQASHFLSLSTIKRCKTLIIMALAGVEQPPAYQTAAPTTTPVAQWIARAAMGEDNWEMRMEGRQGQHGPRNTMAPDSILRAQNGVGGGNATTRRV